MSNDLVRKVAVALVQSPGFQDTLTELVALELERQLRGYAGGQRVYIHKSGPGDDRETRNELIRSQFTGNNFEQLRRRHGLSERQLRRIIEPQPDIDPEN